LLPREARLSIDDIGIGTWSLFMFRLKLVRKIQKPNCEKRGDASVASEQSGLCSEAIFSVVLKSLPNRYKQQKAERGQFVAEARILSLHHSTQKFSIQLVWSQTLHPALISSSSALTRHLQAP